MENLNYSTVNSIFSLASKPTVYTNNVNCISVCSIVILNFCMVYGFLKTKDKKYCDLLQQWNRTRDTPKTKK